MQIHKLSYDIDEKVIEEFENRHAMRLPYEFRKFLLENNVAYFDPSGFVIDDYRNISDDTPANNSLNCICGFASPDHKSRSLDWMISTYNENGRIDNKFLPIACDFFGNVICMSLENENIYFWNHETEDCADMLCIAPGFKEFLLGLKE